MTVWTVEEVAQRLNLKATPSNDGIEFHGANPLGQGASEDGFILYPEGNAWDRKADIKYKSKEVAEMAGLTKEEYLPCVEYREANGSSYAPATAPQTGAVKTGTPKAPNLKLVKSEPKTFDIRTLAERGIRKSTFLTFGIELNGDCWQYPTTFPDGSPGRVRLKVCNPPQKFQGKKPQKYLWSPRDKRDFPIVYNLNAMRGKSEVFLVNGEVSVWACHQAGIPAIAGFGENRNFAALVEQIKAAGITSVIVILDNDDTGHKGAVKFKKAAEEAGLSCRVMDITGKTGRDVADLYEDCEFDDEAFETALLSLPQVNATKLQEWEDGTVEEAPAPAPARKEKDGEEEKMAKAQALVELSMSKIEVFQGEDSSFYASVPVTDHRETYDINTTAFAKYLRYEWRMAKGGKVLDSTTIKDAIADIESRTQFEGEKKPISVRTAFHEGKIYIDLLNDKWEAVEIDSEGWRITRNPPVHFRRPDGMKPLPYPELDGDLNELREILNAEDETEWIKMMAWLIAAIRPAVAPYAVLSIHGEQGTAKSTACKVLRSLIDPNFTTMIGSDVGGQRDLAIQAKNQHVIGFDNMSGMPKWLSDTLCSLATEGSFRIRKLHTNDEESLFKAKRPIMLNGIDEMIGREDFRNRCIVVNLPVITSQKRMSDELLWQQFDVMHPAILGQIFNILSYALKTIDGVTLSESPRMMDFARWVVAAEPMMPWQNDNPKGSRFLDIYMENQKEASIVAAQSSPLAAEIAEFMKSKDNFVGTPKTLWATLNQHVDYEERKSNGWPTSPSHLTVLLNRVAAILRGAYGLNIDTGARMKGERVIQITRAPQEEEDE